MDESAHPNKPLPDPTTPQVADLLKALEIQSVARRSRRPAPAAALQTPSFRYGSLAAIVIFTFGSLGLLQWFLSQMPRPAHTVSPLPPGISAPARP